MNLALRNSMLFNDNKKQKTKKQHFPHKGKRWLFIAFSSFVFLTGCNHFDIKDQEQAPAEETQAIQVLSTSNSIETLTPADEIEALLKAEFTLQREGPNKAFEQFYALSDQSSDIHFIERLNHIALASNNDSYIERSTNLWLAAKPDAEQAYSLQLQVFIKNNRPEDITRLLINAIQQNVNLHFLPQHLESNSRDTVKVDTLNTAIANLPTDFQNNEHVLLSRAHIFLLTGEYRLAINLIEKDFSSPSTEKKEALYLILALSQKNLGMTNKAISTLINASKRFPESTRIPPPLIDFYVEQKQISKAVKTYQDCLLEHADKLQVGINFVRTLLKHNQPSTALTIIKELPEDQTGFTDQVQFLKALALADTEQKIEAIKVMNEVEGNLRTSATQQIAFWLYDENKENQINNMVLKRTKRENMQEQVMLISNLHEEKDRFGLSYELLQMASKVYPESNALRYRKALLADALGQWQVTESEMTTLLQKDPLNPQYLNALGYTLLTRTDRIDEAMQYIESAYELADDDPAIIDSLGWGHFLRGELDQASYFLNKAWGLLQDDEIAAHYGESLWSQRHYDKAIEVWEAALNSSPNAKVLIETIQRLSPSLLESLQ
ncbi:tetratricopeptide repeat protein [Marinomonas sp. C2222]|uniref:Tetratricopeptide repeat protein n=1 Tax=Marinomonas sargassi TaxID=2984494 RepID=A0ABT2YUZ2_9GAMM|nr:tetratricopeptide repeat protein [Marinomonas sargassi]MCV2403719.1 tetratricopeptide repeat protein [Marinomonas sargassi]